MSTLTSTAQIIAQEELPVIREFYARVYRKVIRKLVVEAQLNKMVQAHEYHHYAKERHHYPIDDALVIY
jgi:hypothetical protein